MPRRCSLPTFPEHDIHHLSLPVGVSMALTALASEHPPSSQMVAGLKKFKLIGWLLYGPCKVNGERHKDPASDSDLKWVEFFS